MTSGTRSILAGALAGLAALACAPREPARDDGPAPEAVLVVPAEATLRPGESVQLAAQANDAVGQPIGGAPVAWRPADPSRLRVTDAGLVTAVGPAGPARVVVTSGPRHAEALITVAPGPAVRLVVAAGDGQSGRAGTVLGARLSVRALDASGNPVPGARVVFSAGDGGQAAPAVAAADAQGVATAAWTLGPATGAQRAVASLEADPAVAATFGATGGPGPPARLVPVAVPAPADGAPAPLEVRVVDAEGRAVPGVEVRWKALSRGLRLEPPAGLSGPEGTATTRVVERPRARAARAEASAEGVTPAVLEVAAGR